MDVPEESKLGWFISIIGITYYIPPMLLFYHVFKKKIKYEDSPGLIVLANYFTNYMWAIYGDCLFSPALKWTSIISSIISAIMLLIYLFYELKEYLADSILNLCVLITTSWAIYNFLAEIIEDDEPCYRICLICQLIAYVTPFQLIHKLWYNGEYNLFPIYSSYIGIFVCTLWVYYALTLEDEKDYGMAFVFLSGLVCSVVQVVVWLKIKKRGGNGIGAFKTIRDTSIEGDLSKENITVDDKDGDNAISKLNEDKAKVQKVKIIKTENSEEQN